MRQTRSNLIAWKYALTEVLLVYFLVNPLGKTTWSPYATFAAYAYFMPGENAVQQIFHCYNVCWEIFSQIYKSWMLGERMIFSWFTKVRSLFHFIWSKTKNWMLGERDDLQLVYRSELTVPFTQHNFYLA